MFSDTKDYYKAIGKGPEKVKFMEEDIVHKTAAQLSRFLTSKKIEPKDIRQVDMVAGGDHGKGAFQVGSKVIVVLNDEKVTSHNFEI